MPLTKTLYYYRLTSFDLDIKGGEQKNQNDLFELLHDVFILNRDRVTKYTSQYSINIEILELTSDFLFCRIGKLDSIDKTNMMQLFDRSRSTSIESTDYVIDFYSYFLLGLSTGNLVELHNHRGPKLDLYLKELLEYVNGYNTTYVRPIQVANSFSQIKQQFKKIINVNLGYAADNFSSDTPSLGSLKALEKDVEHLSISLTIRRDLEIDSVVDSLGQIQTDKADRFQITAQDDKGQATIDMFKEMLTQKRNIQIDDGSFADDKYIRRLLEENLSI